MKMIEIHEILERLSNLMRAETRRSCEDYDLQPVHLNTLHYLSVCNKYSDTLLSVASFLGLTKGTTSQTIKVLEERSLVSKKQDALDRRVTHLKLTRIGQKVLEKALPSPILKVAEDYISLEDQEEIVSKLKLLLNTCQKANGMKTFSPCHTCRHNQKLEDGYFCQLTQEPLTNDDVTRICREHEYPQYK